MKFPPLKSGMQLHPTPDAGSFRQWMNIDDDSYKELEEENSIKRHRAYQN